MCGRIRSSDLVALAVRIIVSARMPPANRWLRDF